MLIIGAKGFAKELLQSLKENDLEKLCFYDDVNLEVPKKLYNRYPVLKTKKQVKDYFKHTSRDFTLGLGNSTLRFKMYQKFLDFGGVFKSTVSEHANIGEFACIGDGCNILAGVNISNGVAIGKGALIYYNVIITHDVEIGDFVELSPGCKLLGRVKIGNHVHIGAGAVVLPDIVVGDNSIIGAGSVVTKDINAGEKVVGIPAKKIT